MANILIISALQIFPPISGGHHRTATIAQQLAEAGHVVRIYSIIGRKKDMLRLAGSSKTQMGPNLVEFVKRPVSVWIRAMFAYRRGIPPLWAKPFLERGDPTLKTMIQDSQIIIFDFPYAFCDIGQTSQQLILNSHNVESRLFMPPATARPDLAAAVNTLESRAIDGVSCVMCASIEEVEHFTNRHPSQHFLHVPNCIRSNKTSSPLSNENAQLRQTLGLSHTERVLLFPASRYGPNEDGAAFLRQFCLDHDDLLRDQNLVILVAGSVTPKSDRIGQFVATGPVPAIEPYFHLANWGINPIFHGSGTSIKVAEFIGFELPILTTSIGARGFKLEDGLSAVFFNRENLREKLLHLPNDPDKLAAMCRRSREANLAFLDPASAIRPLLEVIGKGCPPS